MTKPTVFDVAHYILRVKGEMSVMKLQKLVYYAQAWSLVWDDKPLFDNEIQAWANGPVCPDLYSKHQGRFSVTADLFSRHPAPLSTTQQETVGAVLEVYAAKSAQWLSDQTHSESPWLDARRRLSDRKRGRTPITLEAMAEYYGTL